MGILYAQIDCDMPRDERVLEAGPMAELLYIRCVLFGRENLTDGHVTRARLPFVAVGIDNACAHMSTLVAVGLMVETAHGWCIPEHVWVKRNPTGEQVEAQRAAKIERQKAWRDKIKETRDATATCREPVASPSRADHRDVSATSPRRGRDRQEKEEEKPKPEEKPKEESFINTPSYTTLSNAPKRSNGTEGIDTESLAYRAALSHAEHLITMNPGGIRNRQAVIDKHIAEFLTNPKVTDLCRRYPQAAPSQIAGQLAGENSLRGMQPIA